ncbi:ABC transporter ATP-binding protein [Lachnospiraceae bacterium 29-84]
MGKGFFFTEKMCVGYHRKPIVREIEIYLPKGKILCLIGPNGSGKSTVLKSIAKQLELVGGAGYLNGKDLAKIKPQELAKQMSIVLTERLRAERMDCQDVVSTGRYPYTGKFGILTKEDREIVRESMELVHVLEIAKRDFTKVSDGQKQRVMLARAICQQPDLILLDEPTSYLDIKHKLEFLSVLQELKEKKGLTVILSLHELELAQRVSDQILCLRGGYVEKYGSPKEVFQPGYIRRLFDMTAGSYDENSGSMELSRPSGEAEVFVLAGGGSGREVYHMLQREGKPFATGILFDNDLDYPPAKALSSGLIAAKAFEPIPSGLLDYAKETLSSCQQVICCRESFGSLETANQELYAYARQSGKIIVHTATWQGF